MSLDYTTVLAQIVNFVILAWALYKFLYKPLLVAVDKREKHIASEISNAETLAAEAEKKLEDLNRRYLDIDRERAQILQDARDEAERLRKELEQKVQAEVLEKRLLLQQELNREKTAMSTEVRQTVVDNFQEFARKAFERLGDESLESRFLSVFKRRLQELPAKDKAMLAAEGGNAPLQIVTSAELSEDARESLKKAVAEVLGAQASAFAFDVNPRLLCGIELSVNGNVVSWNLDDYLNAFAVKMNDALENISLRLKSEEA